MSLEQELGRILKAKRLTISVAESLTGGLVGDMITNVPGSSSYFEGAVTTYSNESKVELLKVRNETLRLHGAVSEECALEMASGVRELFHTKVGISVTGIAGPSGESFGKPVGLVHFGFDNGVTRITGKKIFEGDREEIKKASAEHLIAMTVELLTES
ncbi:MAG: CinA family protein [Methanomassiliicoccales archaeon]|jgi:PncC family amidohydrolase